MHQCTEIAIFTVAKENMDRAIALSQAIFSEMNVAEKVITSYQVLRKTDNPEELCWHLTWINAEVAKVTTQKWPTFPSTKEFQDLVVKDLYGYFPPDVILLPPDNSPVLNRLDCRPRRAI